MNLVSKNLELKSLRGWKFNTTMWLEVRPRVNNGFLQRHHRDIDKPALHHFQSNALCHVGTLPARIPSPETKPDRASQPWARTVSQNKLGSLKYSSDEKLTSKASLQRF